MRGPWAEHEQGLVGVAFLVVFCAGSCLYGTPPFAFPCPTANLLLILASPSKPAHYQLQLSEQAPWRLPQAIPSHWPPPPVAHTVFSLPSPMSSPIDDVTAAARHYGTKTASGNARIFNCKQCNRAFTREEHLTRHTLSTHNKLKPFVCGICLRPFSRRDLLLRHAKNLHKGLEAAVSRIRKLYARTSSKDDVDDDDEQEMPEEDVSLVLEPASDHSPTAEAEAHIPRTEPPPAPVYADYDTPEKKRLKMLVNMLVS